MSEFMDELKKEGSKQKTENGAFGFSTSGKPLVDFNFKLPSFRDKPNDVKRSLLHIVKEEDPYLLKYLFYLRDCRNGAGERDTFRTAIVEALKYVKDGEKIISLIPEYGRWDDLLVFIGSEYEEVAFSLIKEQFCKDNEGMKEGKPISLLAKWMPSDNASSKKSRYMASKLMKFLGLSKKEYRANLVALRKYLDVLEVKACSNKWGEIDYNKVPSNANLRYRTAFLKHDEERRKNYLNDLASGKEGVKINSATNFPHDIVHRYFGGDAKFWGKELPIDPDIALEELWKNLPDMAGLGNTLVVRDGSGSMFGTCLPGTKVTAIDVADALSVYASERCLGEFKDTFITFSSYPKLVSLKDFSSLHDKLEELHNYEDISNTDLEATFDLVLKVAIKGKIPQEELPSQILIISDMEFDMAHTHYGDKNHDMETLMEVVGKKYEEAGYKLPKLVFWNVNGRTNTIPMRENEFGLILVSGYSVHIMNLISSGEVDPYKAIISYLDSERYLPIPLAEYK